MKKNLGADIEDRGVESHAEVFDVNGIKVPRIVPPAVDGLGNPAAAEDAGAD